jgi:hypothetical protein
MKKRLLLLVAVVIVAGSTLATAPQKVAADQASLALRGRSATPSSNSPFGNRHNESNLFAAAEEAKLRQSCDPIQSRSPQFGFYRQCCCWLLPT